MMAALVYQTLWVKQLALIVGVDVVCRHDCGQRVLRWPRDRRWSLAGDFSGSGQAKERECLENTTMKTTRRRFLLLARLQFAYIYPIQYI